MKNVELWVRTVEVSGVTALGCSLFTPHPKHSPCSTWEVLATETSGFTA